MDQIVADNSVKEDEYEGKVKDLQEEFKLADTRAEFAERSVDKVHSILSWNIFLISIFSSNQPSTIWLILFTKKSSISGTFPKSSTRH